MLALLGSAFLGACRSEVPLEKRAPEQSAHFVVVGATLPGVGVRDLEIRDGLIVSVGKVEPGLPRVDAAGRYLTPAIIDSHVHLAYLEKTRELARHGVAGAVDLASPKGFLGVSHAPLTLLASGPMITAPHGYPTESWGSAGYGLEVEGAKAAAAAVEELWSLGARVVKVPIDSGPVLDDAALGAVALAAHTRGMKLVAHALGDADAARGAVLGVDVLAHTPVEALSSETASAFKGRAVVSTLSAFGGLTARANLKQLRTAGAVVLYGTDFGNTQVAGPSSREINELVAAGLDGEAVLACMTSAPADYWGFSQLGRIEVGRSASFLLLDRDPLADPSALAAPAEVFIDGVLQRD